GAIVVSAGLLARSPRALAQQADPILAGRPLVRYPEKTDLILLTSRPPQLETPMTYFDRAITANDAFFVRYHTFPVPTSVDVGSWRLRVTGLVDRPLELLLDDLRNKFPKATVTAVTQCAGNSRGRFAPRVLGGEWGDGALGKAEWVGARLRDLLAAAGVRQGAVQATFEGLDKPAFPSVPHFVKSLDLRRIVEDPDVIVAYQMNGRELPMLNGFPARLVVPGWYATYWVKNLSEIAVVDHVFEKFWMKPAYRIPDTPFGCGARSSGRTSAGARSVSGARSGRRQGRATTRSWSGRSTRSASRRGPSPSGIPPATCATSSSTAAFTRARRRAMRRTLVLAALVTALPLTAAAHTKAITLPPDHAYGDLTPGPGVEVAQRACRSCHSTDYIVMQPRSDAKQWEAVVTKMIKVFGASISDEDAKAIVRYLSTAYGKSAPPGLQPNFAGS